MTVQDHAVLSAGKGAWDLGLCVIYFVFRVLSFRRGHSALNCENITETNLYVIYGDFFFRLLTSLLL
jgi:hypothetical protein